jgi:hypothetical protein
MELDKVVIVKAALDDTLRSLEELGLVLKVEDISGPENPDSMTFFYDRSTASEEAVCIESGGKTYFQFGWMSRILKSPDFVTQLSGALKSEAVSLYLDQENGNRLFTLADAGELKRLLYILSPDCSPLDLGVRLANEPGATTGDALEQYKRFLQSQGFHSEPTPDGATRKFVTLGLAPLDKLEEHDRELDRYYTDYVVRLWRPYVERDFTDLAEATKRAVVDHLAALKERFPDDSFVGYCLYTCDQIDSLGPVANSLAAVQKHKSDDAPYYKYCPDAWSHWDDFGTFSRVRRILRDIHHVFETTRTEWEFLLSPAHSKVNDEVNEYNCWRGIYDAVLKALSELREEGRLGLPSSEDGVFAIWFSDADEDDETLIKESASRLNTSRVVEEFVKHGLS